VRASAAAGLTARAAGLSHEQQAGVGAAASSPLRAVAYLEFRIGHLVRAPLAQKLEDTIAHVQKKLVRGGRGPARRLRG
jgi:hypothetical protein